MPTMTVKDENEPVAETVPEPEQFSSRGLRRPIFPYAPRQAQMTGQEDRTQGLWPWFLMPFRPPLVSAECKAYVEGKYTPASESERLLLLSELSEANTVRGDANSAIVQAPGACSALRQECQAEGLQLISPVTGEASGGPELQIYEPQEHSGHQVGRVLTDPFIGVTELIAELERRKPWALMQLDARIEESVEHTTEGPAEQRRYMRQAVASMKRTRQLIANGMPTVAELRLWFKRFELQRLESQQDQRIKHERALQGRIDDQSQQIARMASEIQQSQWEMANT